MTNKQTVDSYDNYAEKWAERMRSGKNIAHEYLEKPAMYGALPDLKGKKVLCLGCGTGEEVEYLTSLGADVVGVDISKGLIDFAKKSYPDLDFRVMDIEELDFDEETFDFVYSSLVMHYLDSWKKTLDGIKKILKINGAFLFSTHHPAIWGAQRTRKEGERESILGYRKYLKDNVCEVFGDYLNPREINDVWFNDFKVSYFHRSLEDIFEDITDSGLILNRFLEPKAIDRTKEIDPIFWEIHQKIPTFMIIELRKSR